MMKFDSILGVIARVEEFCQVHKVLPEFSKDDYGRMAVRLFTMQGLQCNLCQLGEQDSFSGAFHTIDVSYDNGWHVEVTGKNGRDEVLSADLLARIQAVTPRLITSPEYRLAGTVLLAYKGKVHHMSIDGGMHFAEAVTDRIRKGQNGAQALLDLAEKGSYC